MKTDLTNRARAELLLALHKLDQFEDGQGDLALLKEINRHLGACDAALFGLERLNRQVKAAHFSAYGSQQSQSEDQL